MMSGTQNHPLDKQPLGRWRMEDERWRMEDGGWRMEDGGWRMEDGGWRMEDNFINQTNLAVNFVRVTSTSTGITCFTDIIFHCITMASWMPGW